MKYALNFLFVFLFSANCVSYSIVDEDGTEKTWHSEEIDVYLSPSLEKIGPADIVYPMVEDAFYDWIESGNLGIDINFVYEECDLTFDSYQNCVGSEFESDDNDIAGGMHRGQHYLSNGKIISGKIIIYKNAGSWKFHEHVRGLDFYNVILHEVGHFFGMEHSEIHGAIMYPHSYKWTTKISYLTDDDIEGIRALYGTYDTLPVTYGEDYSTYHHPEFEEGDMACSFSTKKSGLSIFNLLF